MIELKNVYKHYGKGDAAVKALDGVSLNVGEGELVAIVGKSGSGKSTLLNILGGLDTVTQGEYLFKGKRLHLNNQQKLAAYRRDHIGFVLQYFALIEDSTVFSNIALPLRYAKKKKSEIEQAVQAVAQSLGIAEKLKNYPAELSGGQRQRVAIARAIIRSPDLLLADEPTGALDSETEASIMNVFHALHQSGKTILLVTHDESIARSCERCIRLSDGKIVEEIS